MKKAWIISVVVVLVIVAVAVAMLYMNKKPADTQTTTPSDSSQSTDKNNGSVEQQQSPSVKDGVSSTQAGNIAVQQYGGTVKNVVKDEYNGQPVWKVEIDDSPQGQIEVEVSQSDGTVLAMQKRGGSN